MAHLVKNPPAVQETWLRSLGWEDPLEKRMAAHCGILAWRIPCTEQPGGLQSVGSQLNMTERLALSPSVSGLGVLLLVEIVDSPAQR